MGEPGPVGRGEAGLLGLDQRFDLAELLGGLLGQVGGAVGAAVVHHEDVRLGGRCPYLAQDVADVLGLQVRRDDDERRHVRMSEPPVGCRAANLARRVNGTWTQQCRYSSNRPRPRSPSPYDPTKQNSSSITSFGSLDPNLRESLGSSQLA